MGTTTKDFAVAFDVRWCHQLVEKRCSNSAASDAHIICRDCSSESPHLTYTSRENFVFIPSLFLLESHAASLSNFEYPILALVELLWTKPRIGLLDPKGICSWPFGCNVTYNELILLFVNQRAI